MSKQLKVGVIGAGRIGKIHAQNLRYRIPQAELRSIADINPDAAKECAQALSVPDYTGDYQKIISDEQIQAVVICSSTDTHARIIEEAAKAGKHIFCEKPIDHELSKIDRALSAVEKAGVKLQIGFNRRFDPNFRHVRECLQQGKVGEPHLLRITSRDPGPPPIEYVKVSGGLFLDMAIHDFDMARYLIGSEVISVYAVGAVRVDKQIGQAGDIDTAVVTLEFADGTIGTIDNSRKAIYGYDQRVEVFGSKGAIQAENNTPSRTILSDESGVHAPKPLNFFLERYAESYLVEMSEFVDAVLNDKPTPVNGQDGRIPVLIALAAKWSREQKRPVSLSEIEKSVVV